MPTRASERRGRHFLLGKEEKGVGDIDSGGSVALQEEDVHDRGAELVVFLDLDADVIVERFELFDEGQSVVAVAFECEVAGFGRNDVDARVAGTHELGHIEEHGGAIGVVGFDFERGKGRIAVVDGQDVAFALIEIAIIDNGVGGLGDDAAVLTLETEVDGLRILHAHAQIAGVGNGRDGGTKEHVAT